MKEVVKPNGITLPSGQDVPFGTWLGISVSGISQDERYYSDPHKYDPFRFSRARTEIALMERDKKNGNTNTTTTTATDEAITNEKNVADVDNSMKPIIGKVNDTADRNKLNGSWLSTTTGEFGAFGLGRHSWYVIFSFAFSYFPEAVLAPFLPLSPPPLAAFFNSCRYIYVDKNHKITQPGAMVCIPHYENHCCLYCAQL